MSRRRPTREGALRARYGPCALVTGAGAGIGAAFALALAERGLDLCLVDVDAEALAEVAVRAEAAGVAVERRALDLRAPATLERLAARLADEARPVGLLVHNAGISHVGRFDELELAAHRDALDLNCRAGLHLVHAAARAMRARGRGGLVLLSSNSGVLHAPLVAHYAATKAYLLALGEALHEELRPHGVDVLALVPGLTRTRGLASAGFDERAAGALLLEPEAVVERALAALGRSPRCTPNPRDALGAAILGLLPRRHALALTERSMRRLFPRLGRDRR
jgi:short-subunit dehydrogenase